jgi:predicted MFS family arabinose efflux permease
MVCLKIAANHKVVMNLTWVFQLPSAPLSQGVSMAGANVSRVAPNLRGLAARASNTRGQALLCFENVWVQLMWDIRLSFGGHMTEEINRANAPTIGEEFARGWPVVVSAIVGFGLGLSALSFYTNGTFVQPLGKEFGWSVGQVQTAIAFMPLGTVVMAPVIGWMTDKFGARPIALISLVLYAISLAMLSQINANIASFYATWAVMSVVGAGTLAITWSRAVNGWFNRGRGLALGLALMGSGLTGFGAPALANWAIDAYGWRTAYLVLASLPALIALPVVFMLFRDPPIANLTTPGTDEIPGMSLLEAMKTGRFWLMWFAIVFVSVGVGGLISNMFPILMSDGLDRPTAAIAAGMIGLSVIVGRVVAGFLLDRMWAPAVAFVFLAVPAISCLILASGTSQIWLLVVAAGLVGLAAGAEFDLIAFMISRYFGMKSYAKLYSVQFIGFGLASGLAAPLFGRVFDRFKTYDPILYVAAGLFILGALMFLALGKYPKAYGVDGH